MRTKRKSRSSINRKLKSFLSSPPFWGGAIVAGAIFKMIYTGTGGQAIEFLFPMAFAALWGFGVMKILSGVLRSRVEKNRELEQSGELEASRLKDKDRKAQYRLLKEGKTQQSEILGRFLDLRDAIRTEAAKNQLVPESAENTVALAEEVCASVRREIETCEASGKVPDAVAMGKTFNALENAFRNLRSLQDAEESQVRSLDQLATALDEESEFTSRVKERLEQEDLLSQFNAGASVSETPSQDWRERE